MKKLLVALTLVIGSLTLVSVTAAPASAACSSTYQWKKDTLGITSHSDGDWRVTVGVLYANCNSGASRLVDRYAIEIDPLNKDGLNSCKNRDGFATDSWRANPNVLGGWNPGAKETDCVGWNPAPTTQFVWHAPAGLRVYASSTANNRCIGGYVTMVRDGWDDTTYDVPSLCII